MLKENRFELAVYLQKGDCSVEYLQDVPLKPVLEEPKVIRQILIDKKKPFLTLD